MALSPATPGEPVTSKRQLVEDLAGAVTPREDWRIGTEHEKFVFTVEDLRPIPYQGPRGIRALLDGMTRFDWEPILENGKPIALELGECHVSLEPGGQFELSGAPLCDIHETCDEVHTHLHQTKTVAAELGLGMVGLGMNPKWPRAGHPWMPKGRYKIMGAYMPKKGDLGHDMMLRTCTVQVNLDFDSEADMTEKFRVGMALQPVATALWANSPFTDGRPNGFLSFRSHIWTDTDPDRCGVLPFVFDGNMGFERYVDYVLDVPMYFVYRNGAYIDAAGQSFRDFMARKLPAMPGELPSMGDWHDHLTTAFPEVRLKHYLEMRGADGGPWEKLCALPAFWVGLLYDQDAQAAAWDLVKDWTTDEHLYLRDEVPVRALGTAFRKGTVLDLAREALTIAEHGLKRRAIAGIKDADESPYLGPLWETMELGRTPAEELLEAYHTRWGGSVDPIFTEYAY